MGAPSSLRDGHVLGRISARTLDVALAIALTVTVAIQIALASEPGSEKPAWAFGFAFAIGGLVLLRRRSPLGVLLASFAVLQTYYLANLPGIPAAVPLSIALATAIGEGYLGWSVAVIAFFTVAPVFFRLVIDPTPVEIVFNDLLRDVVLFGAVFALGESFRSRRALAEEHRLLEVERERSEQLLRNVLPDPIADRLKETVDLIAEAHPDVTVLFADIAGFTELSEGLDPSQLVEILDDLFTRFDALANERGLEKIKTIGDAYMVAAGVPVPRPDHAEAVADMALAMVAAADGEHGPAGRRLGLRVGIDSGPVVAGVIGRERFAYDLWGDTVNTASRMESSGVTGRVQVTARVRDRLLDRFRFEPRGRIAVKGKGEMETYFLVGRR